MIAGVYLPSASGAVLSWDRRYRYWLHRRWLAGVGWLVFIMLNPSTADADYDDPTIRRCISFAKTLGHKGIIVVNLFAARFSRPSGLRSISNPVGPENPYYIGEALKLANRLVCAWGANEPWGQDSVVMDMIRESGKQPWCFGTTRSGAPLHPLYIPKNTILKPFIGID